MINYWFTKPDISLQPPRYLFWISKPTCCWTLEPPASQSNPHTFARKFGSLSVHFLKPSKIETKKVSHVVQEINGTWYPCQKSCYWTEISNIGATAAPVNHTIFPGEVDGVLDIGWISGYNSHKKVPTNQVESRWSSWLSLHKTSTSSLPRCLPRSTWKKKRCLHGIQKMYKHRPVISCYCFFSHILIMILYYYNYIYIYNIDILDIDMVLPLLNRIFGLPRKRALPAEISCRWATKMGLPKARLNLAGSTQSQPLSQWTGNSVRAELLMLSLDDSKFTPVDEHSNIVGMSQTWGSPKNIASPWCCFGLLVNCLVNHRRLRNHLSLETLGPTLSSYVNRGGKWRKRWFQRVFQEHYSHRSYRTIKLKSIKEICPAICVYRLRDGQTPMATRLTNRGTCFFIRFELSRMVWRVKSKEAKVTVEKWRTDLALAKWPVAFCFLHIQLKP